MSEPHAVADHGPLDLNRASASELEGLPRIGPALAARIVSHREAHGPFHDVEDLDDVPGIGPSILAAVRARVTITSPESDSAALLAPQAPR